MLEESWIWQDAIFFAIGVGVLTALWKIGQLLTSILERMAAIDDELKKANSHLDELESCSERLNEAVQAIRIRQSESFNDE